MAMHKFKFCPLCGCNLVFADIEGRRRLKCRKCAWINYKNPLPVAACVAKDKKNKILIIKRGILPGLNKWALPGGFVDLGESPEHACLRELKEETGIRGKIKRLVGVYIQKSEIYGAVLVIGYEVDALGNSLSINHEVKEAKFVEKNNLPHVAFLSHRKIINDTG